MEKTKEKKQDIKANGEKKLTKDQAIKILEKEIPMDRDNLLMKRGALEMKCTKAQVTEVYLSYLALEVTYTEAVTANATFFGANF